MKDKEIAVSFTDEGDILISKDKGLTKWHQAEYFNDVQAALDYLKTIFEEFIKK